MFNGIIFNTGEVKKIFRSKNSSEIILKTRSTFKKKDIGSIHYLGKLGRYHHYEYKQWGPVLLFFLCNL